MIEHEPNAFFCTCVRYGGNFEILALDVTWDYRRLGHLLIPMNLLQKDSRSISGKSFQVPSPGVEAAYILAKAAAKNKAFDEIRERIVELARLDEDNFAAKLSEAFPDLPLTKNGDFELIETIETWFGRAVAFQKVRKGHRYGISEIKLYLKRILHPTGIWLVFEGCQYDQKFRDKLAHPLKPLFRRILHYEKISLLRLPIVLSKLIRTSLVVGLNSSPSDIVNPWKIRISPKSNQSVAEETCRILDLLETRTNHRISKLRP